MKKFPSSLDRMAKAVPYFLVALTIVILAVGFLGYNLTDHDPLALIPILSGPLIIIGVLISMYYLKPLALAVDDNGITVERKIKPVLIRFTDISEARILPAGDMTGAIRTFGNGGLWGYTGQFYSRKMGSMTWYCTQRRNYILLHKTSGKKIIITPDDPSGFLNEVRTMQPALVTV
jgi:hypothetical protein